MRLSTKTAFLLCLGTIGLVSSGLTTPAGAATYSWPLSVSLPLSITIPSSVAADMDGGGAVNVACTITPSAGPKAGQVLNIQVVPNRVPLTRAASGDLAYSDSMKLVLSKLIGVEAAPGSGDVIACKLTYVTTRNAPVTFTNSGPSTLKLP
jgi:hypothetical protein